MKIYYQRIKLKKITKSIRAKFQYLCGITKMKNENFKLENISKSNVFKVPENYFNYLSVRIQEQTSNQKRVIPLISWSKKRTWGSIAACTAIGILGYFTLMPQQDSLGNESLAGVQNQEIINYLIQENVNQTDFAEQINNSKTLKFKDSELLDNLKVTDKDILQSIDYENIDNEI